MGSTPQIVEAPVQREIVTPQILRGLTLNAQAFSGQMNPDTIWRTRSAGTPRSSATRSGTSDPRTARRLSSTCWTKASDGGGGGGRGATGTDAMDPRTTVSSSSFSFSCVVVGVGGPLRLPATGVPRCLDSAASDALCRAIARPAVCASRASSTRWASSRRLALAMASGAKVTVRARSSGRIGPSLPTR